MWEYHENQAALRNSDGDSDGQKTTLMFSASKRELFTPNSGFKTLHRRLRSTWKIVVHRDEITFEKIAQARLLVFGGPREKFTAIEFDAIRNYLSSGGSVLLMVGEGGEIKFDTNVNFLLEEYGIMINTDSVVRTVYYKYFHPKEVLVSGGVLNREINRAAGKAIPGQIEIEGENNEQCLTFVYPFGATLNVQKPSVAVLSSGSVSFPLNRPVCAFYKSSSGYGRLAVMGSCHIFSDQYIDKEENSKLLDVIFQFLTTDDVQLNSIDAEDPEISDYQYIPDTSRLSDRLRVCLQEGDEVPRDFTKLFDMKTYQLDITLLPDAIRTFDELRVKHDTLTLIQPQFETPLPPLSPAVIPPLFQELHPPSLDLFDLDEHFSSEKVRLAQITNKCTDDDLEYYIRECGDILGITGKLASDCKDAKHILEYVFAQVVEFKKMNQDIDLDVPQASAVVDGAEAPVSPTDMR
ncbi:intraflagellar transport protein 52 homolog [Corticium candelabrum]|uniref:intraflagellar transport protein 52 homolog n=1 Tax=Corticium candelabrum TaxID=121492 RepID=UPI002E272228|nr:intraflagellar transport protein 52 homolog [Corticium candelabrum]